MPLLSYESETPSLAEGVFVAPTAFVIGDVVIGKDSSVWFGATIRADTGVVRIGEGVNVQECSTVHTQGGNDAIIGDGVSMGHHALVHAAVVDENVLVGVNASVLSGAHIGAESIIAAHALVGEGVVVPPRSLVVGVPGRVIRQISESEHERIRSTAAIYHKLGQAYRVMLPCL